MKKTTISLIALGLIVILLALAPAGLIRLVLPDDTRGEFRFVNEEGTIWNGEIWVLLKTQTIGKLQWRFNPESIVRGKLGIESTLTGSSVDLRATIERGFNVYDVRASGHLSTALLNLVLVNYEIDLEGQFVFQDVNIQWADPFQISEVDGKIASTSGEITLKLWELPTRLEIPPLQGTLSQVGEESWLQVYPIDSTTEIMRIRLESATGWVHFMATRDLLQLTVLPTLKPTNSNEFAFEVSQKLY